MLRNYLKVALRNILKNKSYVIINTFGLGIALACCITSYILVAYNIEFDNFHKDEKVQNLYRLHADVILSNSDKKQAIGAPLPIAPSAAQDFAGIKSFLRYAGNPTGGTSVSQQNEETSTINTFSEFVLFADSTLFDLFDFPLVAGSHMAFDDRQSIFIDEERAKKYFGEEDPIGKILTLGFSRGVEKQFIVGGVLKEVPLNSSLYLPAVIRFEHFEELRKLDQSSFWGDWNVPATILELEDPENAESIAKLFDKFKSIRNEAFTEQEVIGYSLEPFKSKISRTDITWTYLNTPIEIEPLLVFIVLGTMILLIACFNLTNTSIAMATNRLKEIGIRKSIGAHRRQIVTQFMLETVIVIFLSLIVGYGMSKIVVPEFTTMWELPYGMEDLNGINLIVTLLSLVFFASILVGLYPAFFSTKFHTVNLLKGNIRIKGTNVLTKSLVSLQFAISVIVLVGGVIFIQNTKFQEAIQFGYDKEKLLSIDIQDEKDYRMLKAKAQSIPTIEAFGTTEHQVGFSAYNNPVTFENVDYDVQHLEFGENYFEVMNFNFIEGGPIDYEKADEYEGALVVSKQFLKTVGLQGDPIGQYVNIRGTKRKIVGVIDDFVDNVFRSKDPEPFVFYATYPGRWRQIIVRADEDNLKTVNEELEASWKQLFPTKPYTSRYQEDILLGGLQQTNRNLQKIFLFLTILGGLMSASGIFSLATLNIAKRTKEIGIRKALGATVSNVVLLLNKEFVIILSAAGILGSLGGYFGTGFLLDMIYAYHIPITVLPVIASAIVIFVIGMSTTSFTILRAARTNPVDTLRDE